ncbi:hypothetical protein SAY87_015665 [Trapa incisa]|uniref:NAD(P)-binding domain-containing protein n=1 Tax=Trapa incisa TaxID=236973 RepID=A0AAN7L7U9_9MYRT|nr:hypothetical protein SAY87_015665 [Trapa incisa]
MASKLCSVPELPFSIEPSSRAPHRSLLPSYLSVEKLPRPHRITCSRSSLHRTVVPTVTPAVVNDEITESLNSEAEITSPASSKVVLVVGGTGGVGQLVVASLLKRDIKTRLILRDPDKAFSLFGEQDEERLKVWKGDTRNSQDLRPSMFEGVTHVICCTGTTAFPSKRWEGDNSPERVDWEGVRNLVAALPKSLKRVVLVSSVGVTKSNELPWSIMNLFGVLKYKKMGEDFLRSSGLPFTILRPGRLTDGPYTSYDLNTLLKATAGQRRAVLVGQGDKLVGEASRIVVAEACIQLLEMEFAEGEAFEINSIEVLLRIFLFRVYLNNQSIALGDCVSFYF